MTMENLSLNIDDGGIDRSMNEDPDIARPMLTPTPKKATYGGMEERHRPSRIQSVYCWLNELGGKEEGIDSIDEGFPPPSDFPFTGNPALHNPDNAKSILDFFFHMTWSMEIK